MPQSLSTLFREQVISLPTKSSESSASHDADAQRGLFAQLGHCGLTLTVRTVFGCLTSSLCAKAGRLKGSKQRLSHWVVDVITLKYESHGQDCHFGIRAHSTRVDASFWAWVGCPSIRDICCAAGFSSQNTFTRFYRLDVSSLASCVLSVSSDRSFSPSC